MNKLSLTNEKNEKIDIDVIDIYNDEKYNKQYIFYTIINDENNESIYASILNEKENSYSLLNITDEKEWNYVEQILSSLASNGEKTNARL